MLILISKGLYAQNSLTDSSKLTTSGYAEAYYGYDFNHPADDRRPPFIYSYNHTNVLSVDLAFIKEAYTSTGLRANVAIMAGTYSQANLAQEPGLLKNILEANAGIKLSKSANLWLDAGVFSSHIGFESAVGKDCWTLTRSIVADNSPYYESGAKVGYTTNDGKLFVSALLLNGWQHIDRPADNNGVCVGMQITYTPTSNITLNYSNFYGNESPDSTHRERFYNDFYGILQLTKKFGLTAGLDIASQQTAKGSSAYNYLYSPVIIARYSFLENFTMAARFEYYHDKNGILIVTGTPNGFQTAGYSINADYIPHKHILLRVEGKYYNSKDEVFTQTNYRLNYNTAITTSISVAF